MGKVTQLWNPRSNHLLRRNWVLFGERIVIVGDNVDQAGALTVLSVGPNELCARLRVLGQEFEEIVTPGHDITVTIHKLELVVGIKAVEDERMLVEFGVPPGSKVSVTLDGKSGTRSNTNVPDVPGPESA